MGNIYRNIHGGITTVGGSYNNINCNIFNNSIIGLYSGHGGDTINSIINHNYGIGIYLFNSHANTFGNNVFCNTNSSGNGGGVYIYDSFNNTFNNNIYS
ncbi:unnamed protein product, partial [marine sediment metagenome]